MAGNLTGSSRVGELLVDLALLLLGSVQSSSEAIGVLGSARTGSLEIIYEWERRSRLTSQYIRQDTPSNHSGTASIVDSTPCRLTLCISS